MQTTLRAAFAIAMMTSAASFAANQARAMPLTAPPVPGVATANADLIVQIMNVCGIGGCAQVHTKRVQQPPAGFVQRAVPFAVPKTIAVQPAKQSK